MSPEPQVSAAHRPAPIDLRPLILIAAVTLWRLVIAALLPVTQDEAYYYDWAGSLAWGYFDHPPGVALLGVGVNLAPGSVLAARAGTLLAGTLTLLVFWHLFRRAGLDGNRLLLALALAALSLPGFAAGVITTPDSVLALFWALALHEALAALTGDRRRWLTAGAATGLGLLGKYTMLVIGPVFLWAILAADPKALRTRWPYLGGLLALALFLPNLAWNANNDWLTLRFQFGHGFATDTGPVALAADRLPAAVGPSTYAEQVHAPLTPERRLASLATFTGSQVGFWGLLLVPLAIGLWRRIRREADEARSAHPPLSPAARTLLIAATLTPLVLFGGVSLIAEVEANWAAMYLAPAAALLAAWLRPPLRGTLLAGTGNLLLVGVYALHAAAAVLPLPAAAERIMRESHGFSDLAAYVTTLDAPVITDRYPYAAMLNFYAPGLATSVWPGISRPSEYSRGHIAPLPEPDALRRSGFWLLALKFRPPELPGFTAVAAKTVFDCRDAPLQVVEGEATYADAICQRPLHTWRLYRYVATSDRTSSPGAGQPLPPAAPAAPTRSARAGSPIASR